MTTSDTPRTDAVLLSVCGGMYPDGSDGVTESEDANAKLDALCRQLERENNALREQVAERDAALARCIEAMQRMRFDTVLDKQDADYYKRIMRVHVEWLREILASLPESSKQIVKVLDAARKQTEVADKGYDDTSYLDACWETCQAVRGMK